VKVEVKSEPGFDVFEGEDHVVEERDGRAGYSAAEESREDGK
jgi:hypothetical protein